MSSADTATDPFDETLAGSAPRATSSADLDLELAVMVRRARTAARKRPRPWGQRVAMAGAIVALAAGGATAAAATGGWGPWALNPDVIFTYRLPSGAWCEERVGNVQAPGHPDVVAAVVDILRNGDVFARADIEAAIAESREDESWYIGDGSNPTPSGYGTDYYNADDEYRNAVTNAVRVVLIADLEERIPDYADSNLSWEGEGHCPGATFGFDR
ncbi:hypothetical protein [Pseudolysinimonas sp.]|uniref:hypothetical protein n=1 Tax=Pseudolysinimonas sp. TaxID=2680009 RepID=UPI00286BDD8B|nr:hypothetical protein [Pseudolysinimonas sp.]